jgi:AmmeMemoRadiSam system protein A
MELTSHESRLLLKIACEEIASRVRGTSGERTVETPVDLEGIPQTLSQPAGCFVSLHEVVSHRLRGCVGRIQADKPLLKAVRDSARSVLRDPRFYDDRVRAEELFRIEVEVSVLSPPRQITSIQEYEPLRDGIIARISERTGLFLPQVARETGWTREQLLARLCTEKLGLPPDAWQDSDVQLEVFSTAILGPRPVVE